MLMIITKYFITIVYINITIISIIAIIVFIAIAIIIISKIIIQITNHLSLPLLQLQFQLMLSKQLFDLGELPLL